MVSAHLGQSCEQVLDARRLCFRTFFTHQENHERELLVQVVGITLLPWVTFLVFACFPAHPSHSTQPIWSPVENSTDNHMMFAGFADLNALQDVLFPLCHLMETMLMEDKVIIFTFSALYLHFKWPTLLGAMTAVAVGFNSRVTNKLRRTT